MYALKKDHNKFRVKIRTLSTNNNFELPSNFMVLSLC